MKSIFKQVIMLLGVVLQDSVWNFNDLHAIVSIIIFLYAVYFLEKIVRGLGRKKFFQKRSL